MIRKIKLYGPLRKLSGVKEFKANVSNVDQVFSFIKANYPECNQHLMEAAYSVFMNDVDITFANLVIQGDGDIKVIPFVSGNFLPAFFGTLFTGFLNTSVTAMVAFKSALVVGGLSFLSDLLAPSMDVTADVSSDPQVESFLSNQTANTTKAGGAAPLIFGEVFTGSVVISAGSDTLEIRNLTE